MLFMENHIIWTATGMLYYCTNKTTQTMAPVKTQVCSEWEKRGRGDLNKDIGDTCQHLKK